MPKKKNSPPSDKPQVPLGQPLQLTDDDLDRLSQVTPEDIENAKALVKKSSPPLAALLDAQPVKPKKVKRKKDI